MSAKLSNYDSLWKLNVQPRGGLNRMEWALVESTFDHETDQDVMKIKHELQEQKAFRKLSLVKAFTGPVEAIAVLVVFGWKAFQKQRELNSIYRKFLFKKIGYEKFLGDIGRFTKAQEALPSKI